MKKIAFAAAGLSLMLVSCLTDESQTTTSATMVVDSQTTCIEYTGAKTAQFKEAVKKFSDSTAQMTLGSGCSATSRMAKCSFTVPKADSLSTPVEAALAGEPVSMMFYVPAGMTLDATMKATMQKELETECSFMNGGKLTMY